MKKLCVLLMFITVLVLASSQQASCFFVEVDHKIVEGGIVSRNINLVGTHKINNYFSVSAFSLTSKKWSEVYAGPVFSPASWISVGINGGVETAPKSWRVAGSVWMGKGPASLLVIYENGGSGWWYNASAIYQINKVLKVGILSKRGLGTGPQLHVSIPNTPVRIWGSVGYDTEAEKIKQMIGIVVAY